MSRATVRSISSHGVSVRKGGEPTWDGAVYGELRERGGAKQRNKPRGIRGGLVVGPFRPLPTQLHRAGGDRPNHEYLSVRAVTTYFRVGESHPTWFGSELVCRIQRNITAGVLVLTTYALSHGSPSNSRI